MPSIRVYAIPGVAKQLTDQMENKLFQALRSRVAVAFGLEVKDTEVLMIPIERCVNAAPLAIEVMYSVTTKLDLDMATRIALAEGIISMLNNFDWLPADVNEVSVWVLPQHDAIFRIQPMATH